MKTARLILALLLPALASLAAFAADDLERQDYTLISLEMPHSMRYDAGLSESQEMHTYINADATLMLLCAPATATADDNAAAIARQAAMAYGFEPQEVLSYDVEGEPFCYAVRDDGRLAVGIFIDHAKGEAIALIFLEAPSTDGREALLPRILKSVQRAQFPEPADVPGNFDPLNN